MILKETNIEYINGQEKQGIKYDWQKIFANYRKLNVPKMFFNPCHLPYTMARYFMLLSKRKTGKTTNLILLGMIMHLMYGTEMVYIREDDDMIKPSVCDEIFNVILTYENGKYIKDMTGGACNSIYFHWKKAYFCHIDEETGQRDYVMSRPFMHFISINMWDEIKSTMNLPLADFLLVDEFIGKTYNEGSFLGLMQIKDTIGRFRKSIFMVLAANTINLHSPYFREFMVSKDVKELKAGKNKLVTTPKGTKVYIEYIEPNEEYHKINEELNQLYYGFENPQLSSITGEDEGWSFDNVPHIKNNDTDVIIDKSVRIEYDGEYIQLELTHTEDRGLIVNCHPTTRSHKDAIILTMEDIYERNHLYGLGIKNKFFNLIWKLYEQNKFYYSDNETGNIIVEYIRSYRTRKR